MQRHFELRGCVEPCFLCAPVEVTQPVLNEIFQKADVAAVGPGLTRSLVREARVRETFAQIGNRGV